MKRLKTQIVIAAFFTGASLSLHGMMSRYAKPQAAPLAARSAALIRAQTQRTMPTIQKRTLMTPQQLKGLYAPLTQEAQAVSPVFGAAKYESGALQRMYGTESDTPAIKLVQELFYEQGPQFKPTASKSKQDFFLTHNSLLQIDIL